MIVHVDESPVGSGKTRRAIKTVLAVPARWLVAVEKIDGITEFAARLRASMRGNILVREIASTGAPRGNSVRHEIEALPERYSEGHIVVICTHAALLMSDLRHFHGWHLIIDEVPNVLLMAEVQSKLDVAFFKANYALSELNKDWSRVTLTEAGKRIDGSDLQDDDSHRYLRLFHQRVADSERRDRTVVCNLRRWEDMQSPGMKWTWWSLFSIRELEAFATVRFLGNRFSQSVSAKLMKRWEPEVRWIDKSSLGKRPLEPRIVTIRYFSQERLASKAFFHCDKGQHALGQIANFVAGDAPRDRLIWSCNEVAKKALSDHLPPGAHLAPRQAGSDIWMHCTHAAMIYAARPSGNVRSVLQAVGVTQHEWITTVEREAILQFVTRTSIRDVGSREDATVYVFDWEQAEFLVSFFASQSHIFASAEFIDLALDLAKAKAGPRPRTYSREEAENRAVVRRANKARYERERRARIKAGA